MWRKKILDLTFYPERGSHLDDGPGLVLICLRLVDGRLRSSVGTCDGSSGGGCIGGGRTGGGSSILLFESVLVSADGEELV